MTALVKYAPPAVRYPFVRSAVLGWGCIGLLVVSGAGVLAFAHAAQHAAAGLPRSAIFGVATWLVAALTAWSYWRRTPSGELAWDGQGWSIRFSGAGAGIFTLPHPPQVLLDMQSHLWVTVVSSDLRRTWLWLECSLQPERWDDLRRAVYSPAMQAAAPASLTTPAHSREP